MKTQYTEKDGLIIEEVHAAPTLTISHSRKISDNNYGSNDYFAAMQIDISINATDAEKQQAMHEGFTLIRNMIELQHAAETGAPATLNEARIAADFGGEIIKEQPKREWRKPYAGKAEQATEENKPATKEGLWQELVDNPNRYFANHPSKKTNPKGPDFRRKGTGEGLWMSDCPAQLAAQAKALIEAAA